ncbi:MAG: NAD-dependent epimerase/dehydratase family protein [Selenomonadaceae bacterium]|nr:NAD-dependent epimerase/dehydratase family protein [Selenomonadaceae bacterium]
MYIKHKLYLEDVKRVANENLSWNDLKNKSLLITGATGMIGTMIVDVLMQKNVDDNLNLKIYAAGRNYKIAQKRFADYLSSDNFEFVRFDVNEPINFDFKVDFIIHAASNTHPKLYSSDPVATLMTNILGTYNLLEYAKTSAIEKFLFLSTVEIYGQALENDDTFDENYCGYINCNSFRANYPEGKRAGEALCNAYIEKYKINIIIPRLSRIYGATMRLDDSKAMSEFIMNGVRKENIILKSEGLPLFSYCYLADCVSGIFYCLLNGECGEAYNIADSSEIISLRAIAEYIAELSDRKVIFEIPDSSQAKGFSKVVRGVMSNKKLRSLGWTPYDDTKSGVKKTIEILRDVVNNF